MIFVSGFLLFALVFSGAALATERFFFHIKRMDRIVCNPNLVALPPPSEPEPSKPSDPMEARKAQLLAWNDQNLWNNIEHTKRSQGSDA